ncbi:NAD-dependent epimerase/dehydratase family protein [Candidatus Tisiphia endosymbiont of Beris chalybata]|uniref:NAD-dependent epimerase/dehydratase family protein n=1 Tax=Candidatus Tisiphia endosymbiont of Beris chalybata TaxID=3066262 RepID=UPI00312C9BBC
MSRYLVTGGAGFIGTHLVKLLINEGHQVIILDDLSTGQLQDLVTKNVEFIYGSILEYNSLEKLFKNIDGCFHLAAVASVQKSINNWAYSHAVNATGTINVFLQASAHNIPVVYASSAAVYGSSSRLPLQEGAEVKPLSPYAVDKYACELQAKVFGAIKSLKSCGLRFFNVYGPGQPKDSDYSGVISIFKQQLDEGKELIIFGDGQQSRDFIHVSDVINMCVRSMSVASTHAPILNICSGHAYSINELVQLIGKSCHIKGIKYLPEQIGNIKFSVGSNILSQKVLNIKAQHSLEEGLLELFNTKIL